MPPLGAGPLLQADDLCVHYRIRPARPWQRPGTVRAVDGVSLAVNASETLGLVGESGCGKSSVGRAIMQLVTLARGRVVLDGIDLTALKGRQLRRQRRDVQIVFQDPSSSLNPRMTVAGLIAEPLEVAGLSRAAIDQRVRELIDTIAFAPEYLSRYPHEFSGGQKQRIGIARALALRPKVIICDEAVSALDVSVQAQIVNLLKDIQEREGVSYLFIAHDLGVVRQMSDRVAVMYLGRIVETGPKREVFRRAAHPYTKALLAAAPRLRQSGGSATAPAILKGDLPSQFQRPSGCTFRTRCPSAQPVCEESAPDLRDVGDDRRVACHFAETD